MPDFACDGTLKDPQHNDADFGLEKRASSLTDVEITSVTTSQDIHQHIDTSKDLHHHINTSKDTQYVDRDTSPQEKLRWPKIALLIDGQVQRNEWRPGREAYAGINVILNPLPVTNRDPWVLHARDLVTTFKLAIWKFLTGDFPLPPGLDERKVREWATYTYPYLFLSPRERAMTNKKGKTIERIRSELQSEPHR